MTKKTVQRRSQLITTFGPGAMVDLPTRSVLIGGLDRWRMPTDSYDEIDEPALARLLERWLRDHGRLEQGETIRLLTPPISEGDGRGNPPGIDVTIFPTWFVCERVETPTIDGEQKRAGGWSAGVISIRRAASVGSSTTMARRMTLCRSGSWAPAPTAIFRTSTGGASCMLASPAMRTCGWRIAGPAAS